MFQDEEKPRSIHAVTIRYPTGSFVTLIAMLDKYDNNESLEGRAESRLNRRRESITLNVWYDVEIE